MALFGAKLPASSKQTSWNLPDKQQDKCVFEMCNCRAKVYNIMVVVMQFISDKPTLTVIKIIKAISCVSLKIYPLINVLFYMN